MSKMIINHKTDDFNKWKVQFDSMEVVRRKYGSTGAQVFRGHADPNDLVIITQWGNADQSRNYSQSQELKEAMKKGGIIGPSNVYFVD
jgi:heme-degrading monooxygenase HmoA